VRLEANVPSHSSTSMVVTVEMCAGAIQRASDVMDTWRRRTVLGEKPRWRCQAPKAASSSWRGSTCSMVLRVV
jgi:hypothetical protein